MENEAPTYKIIFLESGKESISSRDFTGLGKAFYPNGDIYEGEYLEGIRHGKGKYTYKNGNSYQGQYEANKKQGFGIFNLRKKGIYEGEFKENLKNGKGTFNYPNGDSYVGDWFNGKKEGQGVYIFSANNERLSGNWKGGIIQSGNWILSNGLIYEGGFKKMIPFGVGTWTNKEGNVTHGKYEHKFVDDENKEEVPHIDFDKLEAEGNYVKKLAEEEANDEKKEDEPEKEEEEEDEEPINQEQNQEKNEEKKDEDENLAEEGNVSGNKKSKEEEEKDEEGKKRVFFWKYDLKLFESASRIKEIQL